MNDGNVRDAAWRKATYSNGSGSCVEVGHAARGVLVRDTKDRETFTLSISSDAWQALIVNLQSK